MKQLGIALLLLAITVGILLGSGLCTRAPESAEINPTITGSTLELTLTNKDAFDWTNVQLELNGVFGYATAAIYAGESLHIQLQDFTRTDGTKFDPLTEKPSRLLIICDTPTGKAQWVGSMSQGS